LTVSQIIAPLRNVRLVLLALFANFVLIPLIAYIIIRVIPLAEPLQIGLILFATAAGAPFLPKLVQVARGDIAFGVGLMVLLMVVSKSRRKCRSLDLGMKAAPTIGGRNISTFCSL
jgi:predicted Na+-dependent transporter